MLTTPSPALATSRHRVRELVFAYRPLRDSVGHVIDVATLALNAPRIAAATLGPLLRHEPVRQARSPEGVEAKRRGLTGPRSAEQSRA